MTEERYQQALIYDKYIKHLTRCIEQIKKTRESIKIEAKKPYHSIKQLDFRVYLWHNSSNYVNLINYYSIKSDKYEYNNCNDTFEEIMNEINLLNSTGVIDRYLILLQNVIEKKIEYYKNKLNNL